MRRFRLALSITALLAAPAGGVTIHVDAEGTGDQPTVCAAIQAALPGDTILLAPGTYTGGPNTMLDFLGKDLVLMGAGPAATFLDCGDSGQPAVRFQNGETRAAVLRDMTLRNNTSHYEPIGIVIDGASPTLANLHLEDFDGTWSESFANYYIGAALHSQGGAPRVVDVEVRDCTNAGGVNVGGDAELERVLVEDCFANLAPAGGLAVGGSAHLREVMVRGCEAYEDPGAGVYCTGSPTFEDCLFEDNSQLYELPEPMYGGGGGMYCWEATPTLRRCVFLGNEARSSGGGLAAAGGSHPVLEDVLFAGCGSASGGGALSLESSTATLRGVTITGSCLWWEPWGTHEANDPCAILCFGSSPVLERVIVAHNNAGAGLWADGASMPSLTCCCFYASPDGDYGGSMVDPTGVDGNISADPLFCDAAGGDYTLCADSPCLPGNHPDGADCGQIGAYGEGCEACGPTAAGDGDAAPATRLAGAHPNPFNPETEIRFHLAKAGPVSLRIHDLTGRLVRTLVAGPLPAGEHAVAWRGEDDRGRRVASGVYFLRLEAGNDRDTGKLVLLK
ncbi:MAG: T9SS type A sorting domain-containing protein [Candidatus Krumholzibacteriota bacterium]|nr:T9SS type A sorting domain-containing protein [Candidatus Krumholzibacteriota bacterium]